MRKVLFVALWACQQEEAKPVMKPVAVEAPKPASAPAASLPVAPEAPTKSLPPAKVATPPAKAEVPKPAPAPTPAPVKEDPGKKVEGPTKFLDEKSKVQHEKGLDDMMGDSKAKTKDKLK